MNTICLDGKLISADEPVFLASNRGYRYGDGLFETVKVREGKLLLGAFHFERLFGGLSLLGYKTPLHLTTSQMEAEILSLCQKNGCEENARVRLSVSRGEGGVYDDAECLHYLIECWPLNNVDNLNKDGLVIDIFPDARKACDKFSHLKSANFLPYVMAARFAKDNRLHDALVLNQYDRVADATIANVFLIKNGALITPPLSEGCVDGVMRRWIKDRGTRRKDQGRGIKEQRAGYKVREEALTIPDLEAADELFLTNAIYGIRWVRQFRDKVYGNNQTQEIYRDLVQTI